MLKRRTYVAVYGEHLNLGLNLLPSCEMYNVIPAPFCGTVTTSDDPARECTPGTPYVSHRCGCYVDRERYEGFYNATSVDQCRRLAGISAYGTPLVGPPKQYVSSI